MRLSHIVLPQAIRLICLSTIVSLATGVMVIAATLYAKLLQIPLVMSYHTHIPEYIPKYTWSGLVNPMWSIIRWCTRRSDLTLVTSKAMRVRVLSRTLCLDFVGCGWCVLVLSLFQYAFVGLRAFQNDRAVHGLHFRMSHGCTAPPLYCQHHTRQGTPLHHSPHTSHNFSTPLRVR